MEMVALVEEVLMMMAIVVLVKEVLINSARTVHLHGDTSA